MAADRGPGRVDDEGFVYVEDRAKDMVLRAGENVYCAEVEAAIYEHPVVYEAAVFGVPHPRLGEEVAAIVLPRAGEHLDEAALVAHLAERVAPFKIPTVIRFASDQLPRNASGKILKRDPSATGSSTRPARRADLGARAHRADGPVNPRRSRSSSTSAANQAS